MMKEHLKDIYRQAVEGLWETLRMINSDSSLDEILEFIVSQADALIDTRFVTLSMMLSEEGPIKVHAFRGQFPEEMRQVQLAVGEGTVGRAIKERRIITIPNVDNIEYAASQKAIDKEHPVFVSNEKKAVLNKAAQTFKAVLAIPLMTSKAVYGALVYYYPLPHEFAKEEIQLAASFAEQAALAIENARLHQAQMERQCELQLLLDLAEAASSSLDVNEMLTITLDHLVGLVGASRAGVLLMDDVNGDFGSYVLRPERPISKDDMDRMLQACKIVVESGWPLYTSPDPARGLIEPGVLLPLCGHGNALGVLGIIGPEHSIFSKQQLDLFHTIADQLATALENARLFHETRRRRQVAEGLQDILRVLNKAESLEVTLTFIIRKALELTEADAGVIYHYKPSQNQLTIEAGVNLPEDFASLGLIPIYEGGAFKAMFDKKPYVIQGIKEHLGKVMKSPQFSGWSEGIQKWFAAINKHYDAYLGIPLLIQGEIYGSLGLYFKQSRHFQGEEIELAVAFGGQAALSIENAQLSAQVRQAAVQDERNRLARDLHDAVTQTLFSASLVADVLPKLWVMDPEAAQHKLEELRKLTRGALSEMRTMLMELRPSAFAEADIEDLFRHLFNAFQARSLLTVQFDVQGDDDPPLAVKEVFYRVVQESLNNIEKHAGAQQVQITLDRAEGHFLLVIRDDGCGFDPAVVSQDHLGLGIMQERVKNIGAALQIQSAPANGTQISVSWTANIEEAG
jgi:signal transduction histidine kinase/putative methionine-R-sulfoxide reductase with GAF domain